MRIEEPEEAEEAAPAAPQVSSPHFPGGGEDLMEEELRSEEESGQECDDADVLLWNEPNLWVGRSRKFQIPLPADAQNHKYLLFIRCLTGGGVVASLKIIVKGSGRKDQSIHKLFSSKRLDRIDDRPDANFLFNFNAPACLPAQSAVAQLELAPSAVFSRIKLQASITRLPLSPAVPEPIDVTTPQSTNSSELSGPNTPDHVQDTDAQALNNFSSKSDPAVSASNVPSHSPAIAQSKGGQASVEQNQAHATSRAPSQSRNNTSPGKLEGASKGLLGQILGTIAKPAQRRKSRSAKENSWNNSEYDEDDLMGGRYSLPHTPLDQLGGAPHQQDEAEGSVDTHRCSAPVTAAEGLRDSTNTQPRDRSSMGLESRRSPEKRNWWRRKPATANPSTPTTSEARGRNSARNADSRGTWFFSPERSTSAEPRVQLEWNGNVSDEENSPDTGRAKDDGDLKGKPRAGGPVLGFFGRGKKQSSVASEQELEDAHDGERTQVWSEQVKVPAKGLKGEFVLDTAGYYKLSIQTMASKLMPNRAIGYVMTMRTKKPGCSIEIADPEFLKADEFFHLRAEELPCTVAWSIWSHSVFTGVMIAASVDHLAPSLAAKLAPDEGWLTPNKDGGTREEDIAEEDYGFVEVPHQIRMQIKHATSKDFVRPVLFLLACCVLSWVNEVAAAELFTIPIPNFIIPFMDRWIMLPITLRGIAAVAAIVWCQRNREDVEEQIVLWQQDFANWRRVKKLNLRARALSEKMKTKGVWGKVKLMRSEYMRTMHEQQSQALAARNNPEGQGRGGEEAEDHVTLAEDLS